MARGECQANIYMNGAEKAAFVSYARNFMLDAAGLLALLFARELRVARLAEIMPKDVVPDGPRKAKVTAHLSAADHGALAALADEHGESLSHLGAVLVRDELREQWLKQACTTRFESH